MMRPCRMTEMRSETASTSRSLWVMKMIERPLFGEPSHGREQLSRLLRRQHRGRLVEDQDRRRRDRALSGSRRADEGRPAALPTIARGIEIEAEATAELGGLTFGPDRSIRPKRLQRLGAENDVLSDSEGWRELEMLVDHADSGRDRLGRTPKVDELRRAAGSRRRRAAAGRKECSSASSCLRRSRRPAHESRRLGSTAMRRESRQARRIAWRYASC